MKINKCVFCDCQISSGEYHPVDSFERAARRIGLCDDCYEKVTGEPKPDNKIKWGARIGRCPCCLAPIFEISKSNDSVVCKVCQAELHYTGSKFMVKRYSL